MSPASGEATAILPDTSSDINLPVAKRLNGLSYYEIQFGHIWVLAQCEGGGIL